MFGREFIFLAANRRCHRGRLSGLIDRVLPPGLISLLIVATGTLCLSPVSAEPTPRSPAESGCIASGSGYGAGSGSAAPVAEAAPVRRFEVLARYPHDRGAFTQGLVLYRGDLYESTGRQGQSSVRRVEPASGRILDARALEATLFGEGLAVLEKRLVQLTWKAGTAFIYDPVNLSRVGGFTFEGEGWGSTAVDRHLVVSDGSSWLRFFDGGDYRQVKRLQVTERGRPVTGLNELEAVGELIYANVYPSDCIAQIDARSGQVTGWIDLSGLMPLAERADSTAVANGIAYDPDTKELFVTGKLWPYIFKLRLLPRETMPDKQAVTTGSTAERRS